MLIVCFCKFGSGSALAIPACRYGFRECSNAWVGPRWDNSLVCCPCSCARLWCRDELRVPLKASLNQGKGASRSVVASLPWVALDSQLRWLCVRSMWLWAFEQPKGQRGQVIRFSFLVARCVVFCPRWQNMSCTSI